MPRKGNVYDIVAGIGGSKIKPKGDQPEYSRGRHALQTSKNLISYRTCVADVMRGWDLKSKGVTGRAGIHEAFRETAKECKQGGWKNKSIDQIRNNVLSKIKKQ